MTKQELVKEVARRALVTDDTAGAVIEEAMTVIKETVAKKESVFLRGFGTFGRKHRAEKKARNISKGTTVIVPARDVPHFKPSKAFEV